MSYIGNIPPGAMGIGGSNPSQINLPVIEVNAGPFNVLASMQGSHILCDCSGGVIEVQMPLIDQVPNGWTVFIKKTDLSNNSVEISTSGPSLINGLANQSITSQWNGIGIQRAGDNWVTFSSSFALPELSTGSGSNNIQLSDLTDVQINSPILDQILKFNGTSWVNGQDQTSTPSTPVSIDNLTDVNITSAQSNQFLQFDGTEWKNVDFNPVGISSFTQLDESVYYAT